MMLGAEMIAEAAIEVDETAKMPYTVIGTVRKKRSEASIADYFETQDEALYFIGENMTSDVNDVGKLLWYWQLFHGTDELELTCAVTAFVVQ